MPLTARVVLEVLRAMLVVATAATVGASLGWLEQSKQSKQWLMEDWAHDTSSAPR